MEDKTILIPSSIKGSLKLGWQKMKQNFLSLMLVVFVLHVAISVSSTIAASIAASIAKNWIEDLPKGFTYILYDSYYFRFVFQPLQSVVMLLFLPIFTYSADLMYIHAIRNQKLNIRNLLVGFKNYLDVVLAHLLTTTLIGIALVALVIPGIIVACRLAFVSYLVMDRGLDPLAAIEASWKMTKGHGWKIFGLAMICFPILILGLVNFIVGILPAWIWIKASFASVYETILIEQKQQTEV